MGRGLPALAFVAGLLTCLAVDGVRGDEAAEIARLIDGQIQSRLNAAGIERVPPADDAEFLRRVFLDLHGVVPSVEQAARFLDSNDPHKRSRLIDELLASPRFGEHFGDLWRRRLVSPLASEQRPQTERFAGWLAQRFHRNDGWDRVVFDRLTAAGKIDENPAVTYLIEGRNPLSVTDLTDLSSRRLRFWGAKSGSPLLARPTAPHWPSGSPRLRIPILRAQPSTGCGGTFLARESSVRWTTCTPAIPLRTPSCCNRTAQGAATAAAHCPTSTA